ncbi:MAG: metallophosphoesterase [Lachnospiraceae bacterium]|nr:metallophosphoesterase [Lachnospiraceae bacterium]
MRVVIISDTHRKNDNFIRIMEEIPKPDMVVHCGDVEGSEYAISECAGCPVEMVAGNNDFFSSLPREREFSIGNYKVWLTHGHSYYVSMGNELLKQEAVAKGVDIVMYGHTHKPVIEIEKDIIAVNPGSLSYPRQEGRKPSYAVMEIDENGTARFALQFLD